MEVTAAAYPVYPYVDRCVIEDRRNCSKPGANTVIFNLILASTGLVRNITFFEVTDGSVMDACESGGLQSTIRCGLADVSANFVYLQAPQLPLLVDISLPTTSKENLLHVPKNYPTFHVGRIIKLFDAYTWIALLTLVAVRLLFRTYVNTPFTNAILSGSMFFLSRRMRSAVVDVAFERAHLVPAFSSYADVEYAIESGICYFITTEAGHKRMRTDATYDGIFRALDKHPESLRFASGSTAALKQVAQLNPTEELAVTITSPSHLDDLTCEERSLIHSLPFETFHLAFIFPKHSNLSRPFSAAMKPLFQLRGVQSFAEEQTRRYTPKKSCLKRSIAVQPARLRNGSAAFVLLLVGELLCLLVLVLELNCNREFHHSLVLYRDQV